jgi:NAD(P)-dependent dehydrogenase (short-subunit alcohol dehydrogenase family)
VLVLTAANGGSEHLGRALTDMDAYRTLYDVAVVAPMLLVRAAHPFLQAGDGGSVVMVSDE